MNAGGWLLFRVRPRYAYDMRKLALTAATLVISTPALGQTACDKIASDWDTLERELALKEVDMARERDAARASILATQIQTIYSKGNSLSLAAERLKCARVYITPEAKRYINSAKRCPEGKTGWERIERALSKECYPSRLEPEN